jgi:DNA-binding response OmpR family regulator
MNQRLLVIDDESSIRMFLRDIFESKGCFLTVASSGRDGLRFAGAEKYDVIITDMVMPDFGGADLIAELRKNGNDTPIIAITGYSDIEAKLDVAKACNVDCVVYKPFIAKEIINAVEMALTNNKHRSEPIQEQ